MATFDILTLVESIIKGKRVNMPPMTGLQFKAFMDELGMHIRAAS
ncbi:hypothetical protein ABN362_22300 [Providencia alcalifaciens]